MNYFPYILRLLLLFISCPLYGLKVAVFNVGQGNCTIVTAPNQPTMIVDAGSSHIPTNASGTSLKNSIIQEIKEYIKTHSGNNQLAVIISHPDIDHGNWINDIVSPLIEQEFEVTALLGGTRADYQRRGFRLWPMIKSLEDKCHEHAFTFCYCDQVENIKEFCRQYMPAYCSILSAKHNTSDNDKSIVVKVQEEDFSFLLPGDATQNITDIIRKNIIKSNMLMLAHHGAWREGCTTLTLLRKVNPECVLASSGMNKGYKHVPAKTVATVADFYQESEHVPWHSHPINYYDDGSLKAQKYQASVKQIIKYESGFATGITTLPLLTTTTSGNVYITKTSDEYSVATDHYPDGSESPTTIALESLHKRYFADYYFNNIQEILFTHLQLSDTDIKANFKTLPPALTNADFSQNNLSIASIKHFAKLLAKREKETKIILNVPYKKTAKEGSPLLQSLVERFKNSSPAPVRTLEYLQRKPIEEEYKTVGVILPKAAAA